MMVVLVTIRDFLIASALAWVGVTINASETAKPEHPAASVCADQACQHGAR